MTCITFIVSCDLEVDIHGLRFLLKTKQIQEYEYMTKAIGVIKIVVGEVMATSTNGSIRTLHVGDKVSADDLITTSLSGAVEIEFEDGSLMDLGRSSQVFLANNMLNDTETITVADPLVDDVDARQTILDGDDPTQLFDATAAQAQIQTGNEGHDAVFVDYDQKDSILSLTGFDTQTVIVTTDFLIMDEEPLLQTFNAEITNSATERLSDVTIYGTDEDDFLTGSEGNDILIGGGGNDVLVGGGGSDTFIWKAGDDVPTPVVDTIKDFAVDDVLDVSDLLSYDKDGDLSLFFNIIESGGDVIIGITPTGTGDVTQQILLDDVSLVELGVTATSLLSSHLIETGISDVS